MNRFHVFYVYNLNYNTIQKRENIPDRSKLFIKKRNIGQWIVRDCQTASILE